MGYKKNPAHVVTDIAVNPHFRRKGIGGQVLAEVVRWPGHPNAKEWTAFVAKDNTPAALFFKSIGWMKDGIEDQMIRYKYEAP